MAKQPTKTEAILAFLQASTCPDLAALYNHDMEVQVNVAQDGGDRISTEGYKGRKSHSYSDGITTWKSFRVPWKANSEPEYNDFEINFDLAEHADAIGLTGWNWKDHESLWVAYDFDAISGHSSNTLTDPEIEAVKEAACRIPWVTVRKSTSGSGLHLYVFLPQVSTANHTEHAALARAILGRMSAAASFDFESKMDVCGGIMWVWARKKTAEGLALIKQGEVLKDIPLNWRDHIAVAKGKRKKNMPQFIKEAELSDFEEVTGQRTHVKLDEQHKKTLDYLSDIKASWWWDQDHHMLVCHTFDLKIAHQKLKLRGIYDTVATGKEQGADWNCFAFPVAHPPGAWVLRRYTPGVGESLNWEQDARGYTKCLFNAEPSLKIAAQAHGGMEDKKGVYHFNSATAASETASKLGIQLKLPAWADSHKAKLEQHKDGRLVAHFERKSSDRYDDIVGWREEKSWWERIFNAQLQQPSETETTNYDVLVRHIVNEHGDDFGWVLKAALKWHNEPFNHVRIALKSLDINDVEINKILGNCVLESWTLVNEPFQDEYLGNRKWNRNAPQFRCTPKEGKFPTWEKILKQCGEGLNAAVEEDTWCKANSVLTGADYLKIWVASLLQFPKEQLPYLFFYSKEERTGKSTFHEALGMLITKGYIRADAALISGAGFNGELENAILCAVEETNLQKVAAARNRIKDWVTSSTLLIHPKGKTPYQITNTTHFVQTGNNTNECPIFTGDSRICMVHVPTIDLLDMIPKRQLHIRLEQEAAAFLYEILNLELPPTDDRLNVPVVESEIKIETANANRSMLEVFLDEETHHVPGAKINYGDLFNRFQNWIDPNELHQWSKIKFGRELPSKFPKGRSDNSQFYIGNLSLTPGKAGTPLVAHKGVLVLKGGKR